MLDSATVWTMLPAPAGPPTRSTNGAASTSPGRTAETFPLPSASSRSGATGLRVRTADANSGPLGSSGSGSAATATASGSARRSPG